MVERIRVDRDRHLTRTRARGLDRPRFEVVQSSRREYVHGAVGHGVDPRTNGDRVTFGKGSAAQRREAVNPPSRTRLLPLHHDDWSLAKNTAAAATSSVRP